MARDYKRAAQKKKKKKPVPGWLYFLTGLSIGLFVTMLVYLQFRAQGPDTGHSENTPQSAQAPAKKQTSKQRAKQETKQEKNARSDKPAEEKRRTDAATTSENPAGKVNKKAQEQQKDDGPRFDFYTILPELEVIIPDSEVRQSSPKIIDKSVDVSKKGQYVLQAGSFKTMEQADRRKAKLALLGVESSIQKVTINKNELWFRVRIGPTDDFNRLQDIRTQLFKNNITAIPMRVKPK